MGSAKNEHDGPAGFMLRQLTELAMAMRPKRPIGGALHIQKAQPGGLAEDIDFTQVELWLLMELNTRRNSGESFAALAADLNRRGVRGRYGARWYTASVRAFLHRRSVDRSVS
jgi:hypothetical protein